MTNIQKIADEIFQAPTKQELVERITKDFVKNPDGTYSTKENVDAALLVKNGKLIIKFKYVSGDFKCFKCGLTSLEGAPETVGKRFNCDLNNLTSLEGGPRLVGDDFLCSHNKLVSLEGSPKVVQGDFVCYYNNRLSSLKGAPEVVRGDFYCYNAARQFTEEEVRAVCKVRGKIHV